MNEKYYILKRVWLSKSGIQTVLYLGRDHNDKIDYVDNIDDAIKMTKEDAECWKLILANSRMLSIEEIESDTPVLEDDQKEKNNEGNS